MSSQQVSANVQMLEDISPRLKRKLDKHLAAKERKAASAKVKRGPKPIWERNLGRNSAARAIRKVNAVELWSQLLQSPDARLRFEVLRYLTDKLEGKAFTAINPEERPQAPVNQDNRLQVAIQNLIVPAAKPRKALKAQPLTLAGQVEQSVSDPSTRKNGDGQEN